MKDIFLALIADMNKRFTLIEQKLTTHTWLLGLILLFEMITLLKLFF